MTKARKKYSGKFKFQVVMEALVGERTVSEIARGYDINPNLIGKWKQEFLNKGHTLFEQSNSSENPEKRIEELERMIGKLTVELDLAKNFLRRYSCR